MLMPSVYGQEMPRIERIYRIRFGFLSTLQSCAKLAFGNLFLTDSAVPESVDQCQAFI